jgi:uncharacterized membrane protein
MMWPIYLSLIGNVESTKAYTQMNTTPSHDESGDGSLAIVKRQYAAGHISEREFERRVENLLSTDAESRLRPRTASYRGTNDDIRETN